MLEDFLGGEPAAHVALSYLDRPWGLRFTDPAAFTVHVTVRGAATCAGIPVGAGDVVLVRGAHEVNDEWGTPPGAVIDGPLRSRAAGEPASRAADRWRLGPVRSYGERLGAETVIAHAVHRPSDPATRRMLGSLPAVVHAEGQNIPAGLSDLLVAESAREGMGQQAVLGRIVDLLVLAVLRLQTGGLFAALRDPVIGPVLEVLHTFLAHPWTVSELAGTVGVSRALLARRFTDTVGKPPMTYLVEHRLELASDLLRRSDRTLLSIAHEVGYADGFSLSSAYRRHFGRPPSMDRGPCTAR